MARIAWNRSEDGYVESTCGLYTIEPAFNHSIRPAYYRVYFGVGASRIVISKWADTQSEAKAVAVRHMAKAERDRAAAYDAANQRYPLMLDWSDTLA